eukprot:5808716-Prymnesium_polylepis.1
MTQATRRAAARGAWGGAEGGAEATISLVGDGGERAALARIMSFPTCLETLGAPRRLASCGCAPVLGVRVAHRHRVHRS